MRISRIQKTILGSYTVIWLIAVALLLGTSRQVLQKRLFEQQSERAHVVAENVALAVSDPLLVGELDRLGKLITELKRSDHDVASAWLLDKSGKCVAATDAAKLNQTFAVITNQTADAALQRLSTGDLDVSALVAQGKDRLGSFHMVYSPDSVEAMINSMMAIILAVSAGCMVGGLILYSFIINRTIVRRIKAVTNRLDENSQATASIGIQVATSASDISAGTRQQSAALEETSAALEEMTSMIKRSTSNAQSARELGNQTKAAAESGFTDVQTMNHAMADIKAASDSIAKIIKTIDEISFQTNLLALNAAVEAARAGEAGAGFAVVADEVRSLAQRCAQSARETAVQIEDSIQKSERGVTISNKVAESLQDIVGKARQMDTVISEIATATTEQNDAISGINSSVSQIEQVMQAAAHSTTGFVNLSQELHTQAEEFNAGMQALKNIIGAGSTGATIIPGAPTEAAGPEKNSSPLPLGDRAEYASPQKPASAKTTKAPAAASDFANF